jgi:hypothetical protein
VNIAAVFLADALEHAFGARALDPRRDARIFGFEVYQTILPSFFAASISAGVIELAGGAVDRTCVENTDPTARAPEPIKTSRREILDVLIGECSKF